MYRAFGFDLDNTLYDQAQHLYPFFAEAGVWLHRRTGISAREAEESFLRTWRCRTMSYPFLFDDALRSLGLWRSDWIRELVDHYRCFHPPLRLFEDVRPMLERLSRDHSLFLITDGHSALQRYKVDELKLSEYFDVLWYTGDYDTSWRKPAPNLFLRAAMLLDVPAPSCLFVGDNPERDVAGARLAGMAAARVLSGPFRNRPCEWQVDMVLDRASHLDEVLEAIIPVPVLS